MTRYCMTEEQVTAARSRAAEEQIAQRLRRDEAWKKRILTVLILGALVGGIALYVRFLGTW